MKEFLLIFRMDVTARFQLSDEERAATTKKWMDWVGNIAAKDQLADRGNRLEPTGKVLKSNDIVTNGPYSDIKEAIGGYSIVKATSYDSAVELARNCPVFALGGSVEVRGISPL